MDLKVKYEVMKTFEPENLGPLAQIFKFAQFKFHAFSQNFSTWTNHNSLKFCNIKMIVDFLETLRCLLQLSCWSFFHLKLLSSCKLLWQKMYFLLTFKMTCKVLARISQSCRELNFIQDRIWLRNLWWSMWKLCLVKF